MTGFPTSSDIYLEADGKKVAVVQSYRAVAKKTEKTIEAFGEAQPVATIATQLNYRLELTRLYYGHDQGVVTVDDYIQTEWSAIPHFYMDFYVFQYATSMAASMALTEALLKEGEPARARYIAFLQAGNSRFPLDTLKEAGVDFATPKPVEEALKAFDRLVGEMEVLQARLEKASQARR